MPRALENVLVADDDDDARDAVEVALTMDRAIKVRAFSSGAAALEHLRNGVSPDLVVLGATMAGVDGPAALEQIRRQFSLARVPVVFLAANAHAAEVTRLRSLGAVDVIAKPLDPLLVCEQLRAIWERANTAAPADPALAAKLAELGRKFRDQLAADAETLERLGAGLERSEPAGVRAAAEQIKSVTHRVRGSAGSFGAVDVGDAAGVAERAAIELLNRDPPTCEHAVALRRALDRFRSIYVGGDR